MFKLISAFKDGVTVQRHSAEQLWTKWYSDEIHGPANGEFGLLTNPY